MTSEIDWFRQIEQEEAGFAAELSPYSRFNLTNFLYDDFSAHELFVNYDKETESLFRIIARHFSSKNDVKLQNKVIAIVGQSGCGKTSFTRHFLNKLQKYGDSLGTIKKVKFIIGFGGKVGDIRHLKDRLPMKGTEGIMLLDDAQYAYYPSLNEEDWDIKKNDILKDLTSQVTGSVIITTWNVFGWKHVLSVIPDVIKNFDEIIWLDGLEDKYLDLMIRRRTKKYCLNEEAFDFDKTFDKNGLKLAISAALNNPRLFIHLIDEAIYESHSKNFNSINEDVFKKIINDTNIPIEINNLMSDKVAYYLLNSPSNTIKDLQKFLRMERTTIQKRLQELVNKKIVLSHEHKEGEHIPKGKYYSLNPMLQVKMERQLCEEVIASIHKFYDKKKGMIKM